MTELLIAEDIFLLTHDDESGRTTASTAVQGALVSALLLDLAGRGLIEIVDGDVRTTGATDEPLLAAALSAIDAEARPRPAGHWRSALPGALKPFVDRVGRSLVDRGVLAEQEHRTLGVFRTTRWPERDPEPERALRATLRNALLATDDTAADDRTVMLIGLLRTYSLIDGLVEKSERAQARDRAKAFAERSRSADAVGATLAASEHEVQAAVMAAVITSTTTATVAATSGSN